MSGFSRGPVSGQHRLWCDGWAGVRDHGDGDQGSGHEKRNINWAQARGRWDVASGLKKQAQIDELIAFFRARRGRAHGFRFKDWTDYRATGQLLGTGNDAQTQFQLVREYPSESVTEVRTITKPVAGTVKVYLDGVEQLSGWSVDCSRVIAGIPPRVQLSPPI